MTNHAAEAINTEVQLIESFLDQLPIFATKIGYRGKDHAAGASSAYEQELGEALFKVSEKWGEMKPTCSNPECPEAGGCRGKCVENF